MARWQRFMICVTLVLTGLLVSIWFYASKAANCCAAVRDILGCSPEPAVCRGFIGDCGDLSVQFALVQDIPFNGLQDWTCDAFPNDAYFSDTIFVALISAAVAFPVTGVLALLMELTRYLRLVVVYVSLLASAT